MNIVNENEIKVVPLVTITAGIFQFLFFALKLEKFCLFIPRSVLEGFSWGVAITIGFS
jgi:MFS superfamily sulfate permease-like transporter